MFLKHNLRSEALFLVFDNGLLLNNHMILYRITPDLNMLSITTIIDNAQP